MTIRVERLYRYPVKGLRGELLPSAAVAAGQGFAHDRRFAIARADSKLGDGLQRWMPKQRFVMLMRDTDLVTLGCRFAEEPGQVELSAPGRPSLRARFDTEDGRAELARYVNEMLGERREGAARWVESDASSFTDVPQNCLSLVNLESVRDLGAKAGVSIDPMRFRANLYIDGAPAWSEFDWVGRELRIGDVRARIPARIPRCAATSVHPESGERDINVLKELRAAYGHFDMGIYIEVVAAGNIASGDTLQPPADAEPRSWLGHWLRFFAFLARSAPIVLRRR